MYTAPRRMLLSFLFLYRRIFWDLIRFIFLFFWFARSCLFRILCRLTRLVGRRVLLSVFSFAFSFSWNDLRSEKI